MAIGLFKDCLSPMIASNEPEKYKKTRSRIKSLNNGWEGGFSEIYFVHGSSKLIGKRPSVPNILKFLKRPRLCVTGD